MCKPGKHSSSCYTPVIKHGMLENTPFLVFLGDAPIKTSIQFGDFPASHDFSLNPNGPMVSAFSARKNDRFSGVMPGGEVQ